MTGLFDITLRSEKTADADAVRNLLMQAFPTRAEARLVDRLRRDGLSMSLVAEAAKGAIVGYVAFARLRVESPGGCAVGLAPLAVAPTHRRRGIGSALARRGLLKLEMRGECVVFVLGDPAFYRRLGFSPASARGFACAYAGPYFMARRFMRDAPRRGTLRYPAAFDDLG